MLVDLIETRARLIAVARRDERFHIVKFSLKLRIDAAATLREFARVGRRVSVEHVESPGDESGSAV